MAGAGSVQHGGGHRKPQVPGMPHTGARRQGAGGQSWPDGLGVSVIGWQVASAPPGVVVHDRQGWFQPVFRLA